MIDHDLREKKLTTNYSGSYGTGHSEVEIVTGRIPRDRSSEYMDYKIDGPAEIQFARTTPENEE